MNEDSLQVIKKNKKGKKNGHYINVCMRQLQKLQNPQTCTRRLYTSGE